MQDGRKLLNEPGDGQFSFGLFFRIFVSPINGGCEILEDKRLEF